jgi:hypothetical protein
MHTPKPSTVTASAAGTEGTRKERSDAHTPGPWMIAEAVDSKYKTNMRRIRSEREGLDHGAVCEVYGTQDGTEASANAALIAAAPEMLSALEAIQHKLNTKGGIELYEMLAIDRAIAKAKGIA